MDQQQPPRSKLRQRILFIAEAVTLAHVARPLVLARTLNSADYEVHFACDPRHNDILGDLPFTLESIRSIPSRRFLDSLSRGSRLYSAETLRAYVKDDLALLEATNPDLVIGDFRLSLSVSARLAGTPYMTITNAYWSPYARQRYIVPELPVVKIAGLKAAQQLFRAIRPLAFAYHTLPLNRVRRKHGLPSLGRDLRRTYTDADYTLYAEIPELIPTADLPETHHYVGPLLWSPPIQRPHWWDSIPKDRPMVYVTLGSSGRSDLLPAILTALGELPITVIAATAGQIEPDPVPENTFVTDFLPGTEAAERASLVICNGGSPTTHQALAAGVPVLGIAGNLDQYLNMSAIEHFGAGILLRSGHANAPAVRATTDKLLGTDAYSKAATQLAELFSNYRVSDTFPALVHKVLERRLSS